MVISMEWCDRFLSFNGSLINVLFCIIIQCFIFDLLIYNVLTSFCNFVLCST